MRKLIGPLLGLLLVAPAFAQTSTPTFLKNLQVTNSLIVGTQVAGDSRHAVPTTMYSTPFGWGNNAAVLCLLSWVPVGYQCPVTGGASNPNGFATYPGRDRDIFVPVAYGNPAEFAQPGPVVFSSIAGTFTATTFVPTTPLTAPQVAQLAVNQAITSSDGCTANIYNWQTNGTIVYVTDWQCGATPGTPVGTSVTIRGDSAALVGHFSSPTKFVFNAPLNATQIGQLKQGMPLDSSDNCAGKLTDWDTAGGTYVNASGGYFVKTSGASCTPTGTTVIISEIIKLFAENPVMILHNTSRATQIANEYDCINSEYDPLFGVSGLGVSVNPDNVGLWCLDITTNGTHPIQNGLQFRDNPASGAPTGFRDAIEILSGALNAAVDVRPQQHHNVGIAFSSRSDVNNGNTIGDAFRDWDGLGQIWAQIPADTGILHLGYQGNSTSTPAVVFHSSVNHVEDASVTVTGGTSTPDNGFISLNAGKVTLNSPALVMGGVTPQIEYGSSTTVNTPYFDWHSSGNNIDYDVRLQASGGSSTSGQGTFTISAGTLSLNGGIFYTTGTTPTLGACGTSPSISGTDVSGKITIGSGTVTSCAVNFHATLPNAPHGVTLTPANATAAAQSTTLAYISGWTASGWTITGTALAGAVYTYHVE